MNIISCRSLLLILTTQVVLSLDQMKDINDESSIDICKGNDADMLWKVDVEEKKISKLEWFFNNKIICNSSTAKGFTVSIPYQQRIERIGQTGIKLKNVSLDDEGAYVLFPLIAWSTSESMKKIDLHIKEPPTDNCTCKMGRFPDFRCELPASGCGRPKVSIVFKRKQTYEVLGEGNWVMNSTLQDKEILCCLDGEAMKCADDKRRFCTTVSFPHEDNDRPPEDGKTQHTYSVTVPEENETSLEILELHEAVKPVIKDEEITPMLIMNCKDNKTVDPIITHDPVLGEAEMLPDHQQSLVGNLDKDAEMASS